MGPLSLYCHVSYLSKPRRRLGFRAENMCNLGCCFVLSEIQYRTNSGRWVWLVLVPAHSDLRIFMRNVCRHALKYLEPAHSNNEVKQEWFLPPETPDCYGILLKARGCGRTRFRTYRPPLDSQPKNGYFTVVLCSWQSVLYQVCMSNSKRYYTRNVLGVIHQNLNLRMCCA